MPLVSTDKIKPYKNNPRINSDAVDQVANSINEFGFQQSILVDKNMVVVAGHTRLEAAKKLGLKKVPISVVGKDTPELTPKQIKAFRIADNKTHEYAQWDWDLLKDELKGLGDVFTGFNDEELKKMFSSTNENLKDYSDSSGEVFYLRIECNDEKHQQELYEELTERGLTCQVQSL